MDDDKECIVCFEKGNDLINYNHCNNCFIHKGCLKKWFIQNKNLCLICKNKIFEDDDLNNHQLILKVFDIDCEEDIENNINSETIHSNTINNEFIFYDNRNMLIQTNENINSCTRFLVSFLFFAFLFSLFYIIIN